MTTNGLLLLLLLALTFSNLITSASADNALLRLRRVQQPGTV